VPCARLSWPSRQFLSARKCIPYRIISYLINFSCNLDETYRAILITICSSPDCILTVEVTPWFKYVVEKTSTSTLVHLLVRAVKTKELICTFLKSIHATDVTSHYDVCLVLTSESIDQRSCVKNRPPVEETMKYSVRFH